MYVCYFAKLESRTDYVQANWDVIFTPDNASNTVLSVSTLNDTVLEGDEEFTILLLSVVPDLGIVENGILTVIITDINGEDIQNCSAPLTIINFTGSYFA